MQSVYLVTRTKPEMSIIVWWRKTAHGYEYVIVWVAAQGWGRIVVVY